MTTENEDNKLFYAILALLAIIPLGVWEGVRTRATLELVCYSAWGTRA
jgi:hypothetical protein